MKKIASFLIAASSLLAAPAFSVAEPIKELTLVRPSSVKEVKETFVQVKGAKLFCRVMGKGNPIIVVHGGPGLSQDYLQPQLQKLAEGHQVIFYDQRGSGESVGEADSKNIQMDTFVEDLEGIRNAFGLNKVTVLGHSFGGLLAMEYAIAHPEAIDKLVIVSSSPGSSDDFAQFLAEWNKRVSPYFKEMQKIEETQAFKEGDSETVANLFKLMFNNYCFNADDVAKLSLKISSQGNVNGRRTNKLFQKNFYSKPFNIFENLQKLNCKTLIVHGDVDVVPLSTAENLHKNIKNSQFVVIKDCGHFPYVEKPQEFFDSVQNFLEDRR
jgi:proline iminopeptidase